jgi:hypothetical protein
MKVTRTIEEYDADGKLTRRCTEVTETLEPAAPSVPYPVAVPVQPQWPNLWPPYVTCERNGYINPGNVCTETLATACAASLAEFSDSRQLPN